MKKNKRIWSWALASALAVSNLSAVAMPFTSIVAQAAYTSLITPTTYANNVQLIGNSKFAVNVLDETLTLPAYTYTNAAVTVSDTLDYLLSIDGGAATSIKQGTATGAGSVTVPTVDIDLRGRAGKTLTIDVVFEDVDNSNTKTTVTTIEIDIVDGTEATAADLASIITLDGEDTVMIGDTNIIAADFGDKDPSIFVPDTAVFSVELKNGDGGKTNVTRSANTDGNKYGSATSGTFSGQNASGEYVATLTYDADGAGGEDPVDIMTKTVTVLPGIVKEFGSLTEKDGKTTIGMNDRNGLLVTVPATLYHSAVGTDKLDFHVVKKSDYDSAYARAVAAYSDAEDDFNDGIKTATQLKTAKDTMTTAITVGASGLTAQDATVIPAKSGTATNNKTSYSQDVKITTNTAVEGEYYLLAYEKSCTDGRIAGKFAFTVVDDSSLSFQISTSKINETNPTASGEPAWATVLGKTIDTGKSITFKPYKISTATSGTDTIYTGTEITDASELAKITYSTTTSGKNYIDVNSSTGVVTGKKEGTATVTATYKYSNSVTMTSTINVTVANGAVTVNTSNGAPLPTLYANDSVKLVAFYGGDKVNSNVTWSVKDGAASTVTSADSTKASVSSDGTFAAAEAGTYNVFATYTTENNVSISSAAYTIPVAANTLLLYSNPKTKTAATPIAAGNIGSDHQIYAYYGSEDYTSKVTWESDEKVATVVNGKIHLVAEGSTVVKASFVDSDGKQFSNQINVTVAADNYTITPENTAAGAAFADFLINDEAKIILNHNGKKDTTTAVTWVSSDETVATVDSNGVVKAIGVGGCTIDAYNSKVQKLNAAAFAVTVAPTSLGLFDSTAPTATITSISLNEGEEATIIAKYGHSEIAGKWISHNDGLTPIVDNSENYAKMTSGGKLTAIADTTSLDDTTNSSICKTDDYTYVTFKPTDTTIAPVDLEIKVTAVGAPATFLTVATEDRTDTVGEGQEAQLVVKYGNQDITDKAVFKTDDTSIATVGERTGIVKGISQGTATINVTYTVNNTEYGGSVNIAVTEDLSTTAVALNKSSLELNVGQTEQLKATITPEGTTDETIWSSSDENIATVSDGLVSALKAGTVTIKVTSGKYDAECEVTVIETADQEAAKKAAEDAAAQATAAAKAANDAAAAAKANPTADTVKAAQDAAKEAIDAAEKATKAAEAAQAAGEEDAADAANAAANAAYDAADAAYDAVNDAKTNAINAATTAADKAVDESTEANINAAKEAVATAQALGATEEELTGISAKIEAAEAAKQAGDDAAAKQAAIEAANAAANAAKEDPTADKIQTAKDAIAAAVAAGAEADDLTAANTALKAAEDAKKAADDAAKKAEEEKKAAEEAKKAEEQKQAEEQKKAEEQKAAEEAAKSDGSTAGTPAPVGNELKDANGAAIGYSVTNATAGAAEVEFKGTATDKASDTVTIPEEVKDRSGNVYKVTSIAPEALKDATGKTINIGKNIKKIGANALKNSTFKKINIKTDKKGKLKIGKGAFKTKKKATIKVKGAKGEYKTKLMKKIKKQAHKKSTVK